jgi:ADP-ribose pyrophosphatase YjhB (NUDIX family)
MTTSADHGAVVPAVGGVLRDEAGRLLLVLRGNEPDRGTWSLPGGRVEAGESPEDAVVREMAEETGLDVRVLELIAQVERPHANGGRYVIDDFAVEAIGGTLAAGSDALDVAWFDQEALLSCRATPGLLDTLTAWGILEPR